MYPASILAPQDNAVDAVRSGVADMYYLSISVARKYFPLTAITMVPGAGIPDESLAGNEGHTQTFMEM
jgi:hypothetical protein